ncbi:hypothetical protein GCM10022386_00370 [Flavobacterium cheonhonense]|uniref:Uncharacterized protein n=1 Tax=Flavobacterium cheonhonense TaxID=706185 RepID=A0ABP7T5H8_9FLAO|nr:hypothetical protein [Flavobacterium cheonhonense]
MKKFCSPKTVFKFQLVFCLLTLSIGLYLSFTNNAIVDNAILGLGILATNHTFNNPLNQ